MVTDLMERESMAESKAQKTTPVRLSDEAIKWARIASGYTGESMAEYVSRVVSEQGKADATRLHAEAIRHDTADNEVVRRTEKTGDVFADPPLSHRGKRKGSK